MPNEMNAFLRVQAADEGDERLKALAQPKPVPQCLLVMVLVIQVRGTVADWDVPVHLGIPHVVVDTVEHASKLLLVDSKRFRQTEPLVGEPRFPSMLGRDGGYGVGENNSRLHQV